MMRVLLASAALTLTAAVAPAQMASPRPIQLIVSGGVSVPTGGFGDSHDMGVHADASLLINALGRSLRLRPEMTYARFGVKELGALLGTTSRHGSAGGRARDAASAAVSSLLGGFANIEIPLGPAGFQPFLLAGVGAVKFKSDVSDGVSSIDATKTSLNLGAGVRFKLGPIGGLIEARFNNVPASDTETFFKDVKTIPVTFGLVF
jgi:opacity protein-like surface antigen